MPASRVIQKELASLLKDATRRDLVLVRLAGHGIQPLGSDSAYFCTKDANPTITVGVGNLRSVPPSPTICCSRWMKAASIKTVADERVPE